MIHRRFIIPLLLGLTGLPSIARPAPEKSVAPTVSAANLKKLQAGCDGGKAADCLALAEKSPAETQLELYEKACNMNDGEGCARHGLRLDDLNEAEKRNDPKAAISLEKALNRFEQECVAGTEGSCVKFINAYEVPKGIAFVLETIAIDRINALLTAAACRKGKSEYCEPAIKFHAEGRGVKPDLQQSYEILEIGCKAGIGIHCLRLHYLNKSPADGATNEKAKEYLSRAIERFKEECSSNNGFSCLTLSTTDGEDILANLLHPNLELLVIANAAFETKCRAGNLASCVKWQKRFSEVQIVAIDHSRLPAVEYFSCLAGDIDSCKKELDRLSKSLEDKEKKTIFTVEQIKAMGTRFFEINRAMRRHCRGGDLAFCLQLLEIRLPDFEHAGLSEAREKLVASLLAKHLRDACEKDDLAACNKLAGQFNLISETAINPDHLEKIAKLFDARCRNGNLAACVEFHARKLWQGLDADPARAEKFLEQAADAARLPCERGSTAACADWLWVDFFLGAGRPERELHPERAADAVLTQFESGKFCDGMSQSECMDTLLLAFLELPDPALAMKRFDQLATGLPGIMKSGCEGGNGKACLMLAKITKEPLSADAATNPDSRDAPAKNLIAYHENAWAIKPDAGAAAALLERGATLLQGNCRRGDLPACALAAQAVAKAARDKPPPANPAVVFDPLIRALVFNRHGCAEGDAAACSRLGDHLMRESEEQIKPETAALLVSACRGGESRGCLHLARLAIVGRVMSEAGIAEAANRFSTACEARVGAGCRSTLNLREDGLLMPDANAPKSAQLLEQSCEHGDLGSCYSLGVWLFRGKDDSARGLQLLKTTCEKNEMQSCEYQGIAYHHGNSDLAKDFTAARHYFHRACEMGSEYGCGREKDMDKPEDPEKED